MFCNEIGWHNLQFRQVSGKLADCAVQFANWPDWQIGRNIYPANLVGFLCCHVIQCLAVLWLMKIPSHFPVAVSCFVYGVSLLVVSEVSLIFP